MATMPPREMAQWAKEELRDIVKNGVENFIKEKAADASSLTFDEQAAIEKQRDRLLTFLGFPPKGDK